MYVCKRILVTKNNNNTKHTIICISTRRGAIWRAHANAFTLFIASAQLKTQNRQRSAAHTVGLRGLIRACTYIHYALHTVHAQKKGCQIKRLNGNSTRSLFLVPSGLA